MDEIEIEIECRDKIKIIVKRKLIEMFAGVCEGKTDKLDILSKSLIIIKKYYSAISYNDNIDED
jgi:hypothetical protein